MTSQTADLAQVYARIAGALYLFIIIAGLYDEVFVRGSLIVAGDAAATAQRITASESLFRIGVVGDLLMHVCDVPATLLFYALLRPVSKELSCLAAVFSMLQTAILGANKLNLIAVILLLKRTDSTMAFDPHQREALTSLALALHEYGFAIGLIFFGVSCLCLGYLLYRSGYFPGAWALCRSARACATWSIVSRCFLPRQLPIKCSQPFCFPLS